MSFSQMKFPQSITSISQQRKCTFPTVLKVMTSQKVKDLDVLTTSVLDKRKQHCKNIHFAAKKSVTHSSHQSAGFESKLSIARWAPVVLVGSME